MPVGPGDRLGPYQVLEPLGVGGMGEVYRARHLKLGRDVALKVLPPDLAADPDWLSRFEREARTASALNHPNIVTIHDIAEQDGVTFIAMELVVGVTLLDLIAAGPLPVERAVPLARQVAEGLAKAHAAGIVHRDIKPANIMITGDGLVKILDFGIAKQEPAAGGSRISLTKEGMIIGTPHYMSPEQHAGEPVDHRADQFAFGVVLYEMLGGKPPFDGPSTGAVLSAILLGPPPPLRALRPDLPAALERLVRRCLERAPAERWPDMASIATALRALEQGPGPAARLASLVRRPAVAAVLAAVVLALGAASVLWARGANRRWAEREAPAEITRLTETGDLYEAWRTALRAERYSPGHPALQQLLDRMTLPLPVNTDPAGATIEVKGYATPDADWEPLGTTPMQIRTPYAMMRWRITKAGYETFEGAPFSAAALGMLAGGLKLDSAGKRPPGMVRVPGGVTQELPDARRFEELPEMMVPSFFLDRYEVTNRQFREFVNAGGYEKREWWPVTLRREGREVPWQEAVARFTDATGRPGPASWEVGAFPAGQEEHPVGGLSWFEAAAYCAFAGKSLPTVFHWYHGLGQEQLSDILLQSNLDGTAKAPVGQFRGLSAYGSYDMAGNVKEWAWNATGTNHYIMGAAWNEPSYVFTHLVAADPWNRDLTHGLRCASYPEPVADRLLAPVTARRKYDHAPPLSSAAFAMMRGLYAYDRTPLEARAERVNDSLPEYRREVVSIRTAYSSDRMEINLLIPRDVPPPWQSVIWFPGADVFFQPSSARLASTYLFDFIPRGGRVVVYPVYKAMYERAEPMERTVSGRRDMMIRWAQDISRTIDYLETRPDFDTARIAYYGFSMGATWSPVFTAVEPRFKASILLGGGLTPVAFRPEVDPAAFAPHARTPVLMINGREDFILPYDLAQQGLLALLGAPPDRKRHARLAGGHIPSNRLDIVREVLDWLDQQLGPVTQRSSQ